VSILELLGLLMNPTKLLSTLSEPSSTFPICPGHNIVNNGKLVGMGFLVGME
jgi:hypothetical protein